MTKYDKSSFCSVFRSPYSLTTEGGARLQDLNGQSAAYLALCYHGHVQTFTHEQSDPIIMDHMLAYVSTLPSGN